MQNILIIYFKFHGKINFFKGINFINNLTKEKYIFLIISNFKIQKLLSELYI